MPNPEISTLTPTSTQTRLRCARCQRPASHCLCTQVAPVPSRTHVLVLQHPEEARHPLNTARLAVLGLPNAELLVGEQFAQLDGMVASAAQAWLLFPGPAASLPQPLGRGGAGGGELLIVPDGTWRMARRIIQANPVLGLLPRLSLPAGEPSAYRVRRAREPAAVATIEAIVRTLAILEPWQDFQPVLKPFHALVEQQIQAMGEDVFRRNHMR